MNIDDIVIFSDLNSVTEYLYPIISTKSVTDINVTTQIILPHIENYI